MKYPRVGSRFSTHRLFLLPWIMLAPSLAMAAITDVTWQGASNGSFGTGTNWVGNAVPTNANRAVINANGATVIANDATRTIGGLSISSGFTLTRASGDTTNRTITIQPASTTDTYFSNAGTISSGGTSGSLIVSFVNGAGNTFVNTGILEATAGSSLVLKRSATNATLNNTSGTIRTVGSGILEFGQSSGAAVWSISGGALSNDSGTINMTARNKFTMTDVTFTNGGTVNFLEPAIANSGGFGINLAGTSSFNNSGILNMTRNTNQNAQPSGQSSAIWSAVSTTSVTNSGTMNFTTIGDVAGTSGAAGFEYSGATQTQTLTNTGTINLESQSTAYNTAFNSTITSGNGVTITGTNGVIVMKIGTGGSASKVIFGGSGGIITQDTGHTIRGTGNIGANALLTFTNNGTVNADASTALTLDPQGGQANFTNVGTFANNGTLKATAAGGLVLNDGKYTNAGTFQIDAVSSLTINRGAVLTNNATKTVNINGTWANGTGGLIINNGSLVYDSSATSSNTTGLAGTGTFTKSGGGSLTLAGANSLSGGTTLNAGTLVVGTGSSSALTATRTTTTFTVTLTAGDTTGLVVGQAITGSGIPANTYITGILSSTQFTISANATSTQTAQPLTAAAYSTLGTGALSLNGGTLDLGTGSHTVAAVTFAGGTLSNGTLTGSSYDARSGTVSAILAGSVGLTKTTGGTLILSGANAYTGGTTVSEGKLLVNNLTGSGTGTGALSIGSSATLGGSGIIGSATTISGTLSPGNSPGLLTFSNAVTLETGSTTTIEINGATTRGTDYDGVNFNGTLTVNGGTLTFNISTAIASGSTLNIFDGAAFTPTLTSVGATGLGGYSGALTYNGTNAYIGTFGAQTITFTLASGDLSFAAASLIPEPSTYAALLAASALGVAAVLRRRRTSRQ